MTGRLFITGTTGKAQELFRVRIIGKINASKIMNTANLIFPMLDMAFQRWPSV